MMKCRWWDSNPHGFPNDFESVMPAVSVIIPVYNIKTLLPRCETSLRAQTWQDFEVWLRGGRDRWMQKSSH